MKKYLSVVILLYCVGCSVAPLYNNSSDGKPSKIYVDVIAERDGQQLRRYLKSDIRDLNITRRAYRLVVTLRTDHKYFAEMTDESTQRVEIRHIAHVVLRDGANKVAFEKDFIATTSNNISSGHGDVIFSLYGRNNRNLLKELSTRIVEGIRIFTSNEK